MMERVFYAGISSPIGTIWATATEVGLFQIDFPLPEEAFLESVKRRIKAKFDFDQDRFSELSDVMKSYFDGRRVDFDLPMDLRGTEFQKAVWRAIHRIPYGKPSSYGRLASEVGRPKAVRAAGNAVGANPLSIVIPCHRVVRSDGSLGGFGGGLGLKRYLLGLEGVLHKAEKYDPHQIEREYPRKRDDLLRYFFE